MDSNLNSTHPETALGSGGMRSCWRMSVYHLFNPNESYFVAIFVILQVFDFPKISSR